MSKNIEYPLKEEKWYGMEDDDLGNDQNKFHKVSGNKPSRLKTYKIALLIILILFLVGFIYLKHYRLAYCQTRYGQQKQTLFSDLIPSCFDRPLYQFIWK